MTKNKKPGMFDFDVPFFCPPWRRIVLLIALFGWSLVEFLSGAAFWGVLFLGIGVLVAWKFSQIDWAEVKASENDDQEA